MCWELKELNVFSRPDRAGQCRDEEAGAVRSDIAASRASSLPPIRKKATDITLPDKRDALTTTATLNRQHVSVLILCKYSMICPSHTATLIKCLGATSDQVISR